MRSLERCNSSNANVVTNAANITLTGSAAKITDQNGNNALRNLATNATSGKLTITGGQSLSDGASGSSNAGTLTVATGSKLTLTGHHRRLHRDCGNHDCRRHADGSGR